MEVTVKARQTLSDIAVQVYGDVRGVVDIAYANDIGVTDVLDEGTVLQCPDIVYDRYMQSYVQNNRISPATEYTGGDLRIKIFTEEFTKQFE